MFGKNKNKKPKEKAKYYAFIGVSNSYYHVYEYQILDNGVVELRTTDGKITLMPGTSCKIHGGKWNSSSE